MKKIKIIIIAIILIAIGFIIYGALPAKADIYGSSLIGWWRFDTNDDLNGVTLDRSGNGYNGNLVNIASSTFYSYGKIGQGFDFDGADDYIEVASSTAFNDAISGNNITIASWVNFTDKGGSKIIIAKPFSPTTHVSPYASYSFYLSSARKPSLYLSIGGVAKSLNATNAIASSTWYHIAGVYNGSTIRVYINGVIDPGSTAATGNISVYQTPLRFSANGALGEKFDGLIDDVRIYNRALSRGEIAQLYNMGQTQFHSFGDF